MAKVESIRPGGTLAGTFQEYPLAEFLLGVLRGNLAGRLQIELSNGASDSIYFHNGVPILVDLPSVGLDMPAALSAQGKLPRQVADDLVLRSRQEGVSIEQLLATLEQTAEVRTARRSLPSDRLVRLFDHVQASFSFTEGAGCPPGAARRVLQTLPIVFAGVSSSSKDPAAQAFLQQRGNSTFSLATTYPRGVDPFQWGEEHDRLVTTLERRLTLEALIDHRTPPQKALATLVVLHMAAMAVESEKRPGPPANWSTAGVGASPVPRMVSEAPATVVEPQEQILPKAVIAKRVPHESSKPPTSGLVVHRRGAQPAPSGVSETTPTPITNTPPAPPPPPAPPEPSDRQYFEVAERLRPVVGKSYFQLLRVRPKPKPDQLDRAYKYLLGRIDQETSDDGWLATRDLLAEAYFVLKDSDLGPRYAALEADSEVSRCAFEAEPKVERALRAMGKQRYGEAQFLLEWAKELDPSRPDISVHLATLNHLRIEEPTAEARRDFITLLDQEIARQPHDWRIKLCQAVLLAESGDKQRSRALLDVVPRSDHPLVLVAQAALDKS